MHANGAMLRIARQRKGFQQTEAAIPARDRPVAAISHQRTGSSRRARKCFACRNRVRAAAIVLLPDGPGLRRAGKRASDVAAEGGRDRA